MYIIYIYKALISLFHPSAPSIYRPKFLIIRTVIGVLDHARLASFWLCTVFGFTVPYRQWFERHCDSIDTVLVKEVYS
jgi:hypothetical protein